MGAAMVLAMEPEIPPRRKSLRNLLNPLSLSLTVLLTPCIQIIFKGVYFEIYHQKIGIGSGIVSQQVHSET